MGWFGDILKEIPLSTVLKEKNSMLDAENKSLKMENASLRTENTVLHEELKKTEQENQELRDRLTVLTHGNNLLDKMETQILLLVADHPDCTTETLTQQLGLHLEKFRYYRDKLTQHGYLDYGLAWDDQEYYQLTPKGRKTLNDRQLL